MRNKDFYPKVTWSSFLFIKKCYPNKCETREEVLSKVNAWITREKVKIINIESFDYYFDNFYQPKAHLRIWYE